ncbi:3-ketoacyl-ACP reductase [Rhizobium sp. P44RR-XXIV]|uniref:3-ketoacyl-ACP reductase n=1 Tax=Rhizobium sp. P44RR-XXIV TaxID=1921145 RepID=UPI0009841489|nr:3-ketoacyl-ACP reductase [Rhizobium sp. P44RR-XXIV]TIX90738.1 3-ketoacyl-ACP reductase [Rhizobium sp. P44RR-XXIV]
MADASRQVALVTGAGRGIGLAIAKALGAAGFAVALNDLAVGSELTRAVESVRETGAEAIAVAGDVADLSKHEQILRAASDVLGPLTTLVNNAGVGVLSRGDLLDVTEESYDHCMAVNAKAHFFLTQAFARSVIHVERSADLFYSIVNVTSSNAVAAAAQRGEYCASKAAAAMISKVFATRLGQEGIAVFDVQPGLIETEMTAPVKDSYRKRAEAGLTLFPRLGQPAEIGMIVRTLATGALPYMTGQVLSADGGLLLPRY